MKDLNEATQKAKELFENSKQTVPGNWAKWYYRITDFPEEERKRAIKIEAKNMLGKTRYFISGWMVRPQVLLLAIRHLVINNMDRFDFVNIINDNEELRSKNIFKDYGGVLISYINTTDEWIVEVLDPHNSGRYAVAKIQAKDLKFAFHYPKGFEYQIEELSKTKEFYTHTELKPPKFKENDYVRLINDKEEYKKEGVSKGMKGYILSESAYMDKWDVLFSIKPWHDEDFSVHQDDLELIEER